MDNIENNSNPDTPIIIKVNYPAGTELGSFCRSFGALIRKIRAPVFHLGDTQLSFLSTEGEREEMLRLVDELLRELAGYEEARRQGAIQLYGTIAPPAHDNAFSREFAGYQEAGRQETIQDGIDRPIPSTNRSSSRTGIPKNMATGTLRVPKVEPQAAVSLAAVKREPPTDDYGLPIRVEGAHQTEGSSAPPAAQDMQPLNDNQTPRMDVAAGHSSKTAPIKPPTEGVINGIPQNKNVYAQQGNAVSPAVPLQQPNADQPSDAAQLQIRNGALWKSARLSLRPNKEVKTGKQFPKKYMSDECGQGFTRSNEVKRHKKQVYFGQKHKKSKTGKESPKKFLCDHCGQGFTRSNDLKRHKEEVHFGQKRQKTKKSKTGKESPKKFLCDHCGQGFTRSNDLKRHKEEVHFGQKRQKTKKSKTGKESPKKFLCDHCGQGFTRSNDLKRHKEEVHFGQKRQKTKMPM